ncbi:MAG: hypothetical protein AB1609_12915 [Bacillota bacterium]
MSQVRLGLAFNLRRSGGRDGPEDAEAEYDSWSTVSALAETLSFGGAFRVLLMPVEADFPRLLERVKPDAVFNIAEGWGGRSREMLAPVALEMAGISYTGSDPVALGAAMDKSLAKMAAQAAGVPTAPWQVVADVEELRSLAGECQFPAFVKPLAEGSSKGVRQSSRVDNVTQLAEQVEWVIRQYGQPALVEAFLPGREFSVGVIGNRRLRTLPVLEVRPLASGDGPAGDGPPQAPSPQPEFVYCFHTKSKNLERFLCPAPVDARLAEKLDAYTKAVFRALSLSDVARVDFRLDAAGEPRFLEVNPLPGLSAASLLTAQGEAAGLKLPRLVAAILLAAVSRWVRRQDMEESLRRRLQAVGEAARAALTPDFGWLVETIDAPGPPAAVPAPAPGRRARVS